MLLLEVDRVLRAGAYFVWSAQPVYKHEDEQEKIWAGMLTQEVSSTFYPPLY